MNSEDFRELVLSFPGVEELSHMGHPDFRLGGKIFATLGPDETWGMAKLTPIQQQDFLRNDPSAFKPAAGKWGEGGATIIELAHVRADDLKHALELAWHNLAEKKRSQPANPRSVHSVVKLKGT